MNKQIIAFSILIIFYIIYYSKQFTLKHKGIKVNQLKSQRNGNHLAIIMGLANLLVALIEFISIYCNTENPFEIISLLGIVLGIFGDVAFYLSVKQMGDSWRAGVNPNEKTKLVTSGIYQYSRNPAFLCFYLVYIGILFMFYNPWLLAATLFVMMMLHLQVVKIEEPYLKETFKEEYSIYQKQVNRYLGHKVHN